MPPTFFINYPTALFLGLFFSLLRADIERQDPFYRFKSFWAGILAWTFYAMTSIYAYQFWPHWMWMYHLEPPAISGWGWFYLYIVMYFVPFLAGYMIGSHGRTDSWMSLVAGFSAAGVGTILLLDKFWDRYSVLALSLDYLKDPKRVSLFADEHFQAFFLVSFGVLLLYCVASFALAKRYYVRQIEAGKIKRHLLHPAKRRALQQIAEAILPEAPDLRSISGKDIPIAEILSEHLSDFPIFGRIVLRGAIDFINLSPLWFLGRPLRLENLPHEEQVALLDRIDRSDIRAFKMSMKAWKVFIMQIYYEDQRALDSIGYVGESRGIFRKKVRWLNPPKHS